MENQYLIDKNRYDDGVKNGIYPDREISIARLNAKIYTQRTALINYQDLLQEKKAELAKLKKQLAIAIEALKDIYEWADDEFKATDMSKEALEQIKELDK